jgi:prepilin-type processing-associated H-X9-DG protein
MRSRAFTVVEILVVIGLIAVVVGMLLPALASSRRAAQSIGCASQMRQIGAAFTSYTLANDGMLPYAARADVTWDDLLNSYLGGALTPVEIESNAAPRPVKVLQCPADHAVRAPPTSLLVSAHRLSYVVQRIQNSHSPPALIFDGIAGQLSVWGANPPRISLRTTEVRRSAETLLLVESPQGHRIQGHRAYCWIDDPSRQFLPEWSAEIPTLHQARRTTHGQTWNYLFVDGHVAALRVEDTLKRAPGAPFNFIRPNYMWTRTPHD